MIATLLTTPARRAQVQDLLVSAFKTQSADPRVVAELSEWIDRSHEDGVPSDVISDRPQRPSRINRFGPGRLEDVDRELATTDGLIVLGTATDDRAAWLRTGEALSGLWLDATSRGLSVVPLSQPIEVEATRRALHRDVLMSSSIPHILLRIGWPAISRTRLPPVPRRAMDDVLRRD